MSLRRSSRGRASTRAERVPERHDARPRDRRVAHDEGEEAGQREARRRHSERNHPARVEDLPRRGRARPGSGSLSTKSNALWPATRSAADTPRSQAAAGRSLRRSARNSIAIPRDQSVAMKPIGHRLKSQTNLRTKNSSAIRKRPREARNRARVSGVLPRASERNAPVPAKKLKPGAQKCVTHRVKKSAGHVCDHVDRVERNVRDVIPHVVERHHDDDRAAHDVEGVDAGRPRTDLCLRQVPGF